MTSAQGSGPIPGPLLTVAEVAEVLRVSNLTVYRPIKAGELPRYGWAITTATASPSLGASSRPDTIDSEEVSS